MTPRRSASLRLTLLISGGIVVLSLCAMAVQYRVTERALEARQAALLSADLRGLAALYDQRRIISLRQGIDFRVAAQPPGETLYLLEDREGRRLAGDAQGWPDEVQRLGDMFAPEPAQRFEAEGRTWLGVGRELPGGFPFLAARGLSGDADTLTALRRGIAATGAVLAALALVAGWGVSRRVVGRIARVNALADRVAEGELSARLPGPRGDDEFGALEAHVHRMLDRIETLNRATHRLSDAIAHELRTPLNRILQKLGDSGADAAVREEMRAAIRIFDSLLDISAAEAQAGERPGLTPVDLSATVSQVAELYAAVAEDKGLTWHEHIAPGLTVLGDRNLIAQAVSNLLDNAVKFCAPGDAVTVDLVRADGRCILTVRDTGPGLPDELGDLAFARFVRGERDRGVAGHGLGLALVQAIATRHGAKVTRPATERGFAIAIAWPPLDA
ncbi:HAMP domain-containing histidine kinase [Rhodobacteraceae bacterium CCMM004]|nr:HAMP domain-containing histidine kinase [Rhodobacteraceae bacterium CCMM004]